MPIYGYECKSCGHTLDALQKVSDEPLVNCPNCGQPQLKRQLSAPRFRLKGGGWYETDFKSDNKRNLADSGSDASTGKSAEKSSDSKSDTPSKSTPAAGKSSDASTG